MKLKKRSAYAVSLISRDTAFLLSKILFCAVLLLGTVTSLSGATHEQNKLKFRLNDDGTCEVIEYSFGTKYDDKKIEIPESIKVDDKSYEVTSIGTAAFRNYVNVPEIVIPSTVTSIGYLAFFGCKSLSEISIPNSVTLIGPEAFYNCTGLKRIIFENGVTTIQLGKVIGENQEMMFGNTPLLEELYMGRNITYPSSPVNIDYSPFYGNKTIKTIVMSNYVSVLKDWMFANCSALNTLILSNSLTKINQGAFQSCSSLKNLEIPNSVRTIAESAFLGCPLTNLTLGESVQTIGESAFYGSELTSLRIPDSVISIDKDAFRNAPLSQLSLGNSLQTIGKYAFALSDTDVKNRLKEIIIPNSVTTIADQAFNNDDLIYDDASNQYYHAGIENVILGSSVTSIGSQAFGVTPLKKFVSYALTPPTLGWSFSNWGKQVLVYVPSSVVNAYKSNSKWSSSYTKILPIDPIESVTLDPTEWKVKIGESFNIKSTVLPSNVPDTSLIWTSSDPKVASVDTYGNVKGLSVGETVITATSHLSSEVYAVCNVTIEGIMIQSLNITPTDWTGKVGESFKISGTYTPSNASNTRVSLFSSNPEVATVGSGFTVTAVAPGEAIITMSALDGSGVTADCKVKVLPILVDAISLNTDKLEGVVGDTFNLTATILPENATDKSVVWSTSNAEVASVDESGNITALSVGVAVITVHTADGSDLSAECTVKVNPILAERISLNISEWNGAIGESFKLTASVLPENTTDKSVTWVSSDPKVATVDETGLVKTISEGIAIISATANDGSEVTSECKVLVNPTLVASITLNHDMWNGKVGDSFTLIATVLPEDATDKTIDWKSNNPEVATVDDAGVVTAISIGSAIISATATDGSDITAECKVTVNPVLVESVSLDRSEWNGKVGESFTLSATVLPEDATDKTIDWKSNNPVVATIDDAGVVTAISIGSAIISASSTDGSDITAECKVTVNPVLVESVSLDPSEWSGKVGESFTLSPTVLPEDATDKTIDWKSNNPEVASVDENGLVTALSEGEAIISAITIDGSNISGICKVKVVKEITIIYIESISIEPETWNGKIGESMQLIANIYPEDASNKSVRWLSDNESIVIVDKEGKVTAVGVGEAIVSAMALDRLSQEEDSAVVGNCVCKIVDDGSYLKTISSDDLFSVYNLEGILIKSECSKEDLQKLSKGTYIVTSGNETKKVIIR